MHPGGWIDSQWARLAPLLREPPEGRHAGGRPRKHPLRRVTEAMLYVVKTGCQWRQMPVDSPPWPTVYQQFRAWLFARSLRAGDQVLARTGRKAGGRSPTLAVAIIDLQSARTALRGPRGYDAGKTIKERERRIAVDTQGNVLTVVVHSAGVQDRVGARTKLMRPFRRFNTVIKVFVDVAYTGQRIEWDRQLFGYEVEVVKRNEQHMFRVQPKRRVVERTLVG
jgi:transposase